MGFIKSALELAMEKTEGLEVDNEELRRKELFIQGRVAAAKGLDDGADTFEKMTAIAAQKKALDKKEYGTFAEGALRQPAQPHPAGYGHRGGHGT